jgi:hypothetical protein
LNGKADAEMRMENVPGIGWEMPSIGRISKADAAVQLE